MLTPPEIKKLARATSDARLKMRYLAVYQFESGYNRTHSAEMLGVLRRSICGLSVTLKVALRP